MTNKEKINIAKIAINKSMDYDKLYYSDYMYEKEELTDDVWDYVVEMKENGINCFDKN